MQCALTSRTAFESRADRPKLWSRYNDPAGGEEILKKRAGNARPQVEARAVSLDASGMQRSARGAVKYSGKCNDAATANWVISRFPRHFARAFSDLY